MYERDKCDLEREMIFVIYDKARSNFYRSYKTTNFKYLRFELFRDDDIHTYKNIQVGCKKLLEKTYPRRSFVQVLLIFLFQQEKWYEEKQNTLHILYFVIVAMNKQ